jgi:predicted DNA-binding transcriptional regulator AlpA
VATKNHRQRPLPEITAEQLRTKLTLTVDEMRVLFGVSRDTLTVWRESEPGFPQPRVLPGGRVLRWDTAEVLAWWATLERAA